jgi:hypothetical protein
MSNRSSTTPRTTAAADVSRDASDRILSAVLPHLGRMARGLGRRRALRRYRAALPGLLAQLPTGLVDSARGGLELRELQLTGAGGAMAMLGHPGQSPSLIVKIGHDLDARAGLDREATMLRALRSDERLGQWRDLLPLECARGEWRGFGYVVERALPGRSALHLFLDPAMREQLQTNVVEVISTLHQRTASVITVDEPALDRWIGTPISLIRRLASRRQWAVPSVARLDSLELELRASLLGRKATTCWVHGDFWPGNLLVATDGLAVTGIVDWDMGATDDLPEVDLLHCLIYSRRLVMRLELGDVLQPLLAGTPWTAHERTVLEHASSGNEQVGQRTLLLVYWLRHVAANLVQSGSYTHNLLWLRRNVEGVLRCC